MIFLDSGYFKGLMNYKDAHHNDSLKIQEYLNNSNETTVINTTVLVETLNNTVKTNILAKDMFNVLYSQNQIIQLTYEDYLKSLEVNMWYGNSINYGDCTIINTMINMSIIDIVTFDSDFEKVNGFNIISSI
ncbi:PIN domain-containing protein [Methanobrevibacter sp.]|uniref:PIN domain-containing protein n=1 Tax=Methanobrevibacter sp. TaxID=66852 RepID=UPI003890D203